MLKFELEINKRAAAAAVVVVVLPQSAHQEPPLFPWQQRCQPIVTLPLDRNLKPAGNYYLRAFQSSFVLTAEKKNKRAAVAGGIIAARDEI